MSVEHVCATSKRRRTEDHPTEAPSSPPGTDRAVQEPLNLSILAQDEGILSCLTSFLDNRSCVALACCNSVWREELRWDLLWRADAAKMESMVKENYQLVDVCLELLWSFKTRNRRMARDMLLSAFDTYYSERATWEAACKQVFMDNKTSVREASGFKGLLGLFRSGKAVLFPTDVLRLFIKKTEDFLDAKGKIDETVPAPNMNAAVMNVIKVNAVSWQLAQKPKGMIMRVLQSQGV